MFDRVYNPQIITRKGKFYEVVNIIIYLLIILAVGFVAGGLISAYMFPYKYYHGPNSEDVIEDIKKNPKTKACYHFEPKIIKC